MRNFIFGGIGVELDGLLQKAVELGCEIIKYDERNDDDCVCLLNDLEQIRSLKLRPLNSVFVFYCSASDLVTERLKTSNTTQVIKDLEQWYYETSKALELQSSYPALKLIDIAELTKNFTGFLNILAPSNKESNLTSDENIVVTDILQQNSEISQLCATLKTSSTKLDLMSSYVQTRELESKLNENSNKQKLLEAQLAESTQLANKKYEELKEKSILILEEKIKEINSLKEEKSNFEQKDILKQSKIEHLELEQHRLVEINKSLETNCANLNAKLEALEITTHDLTEKLQINSNRADMIEKQAIRAEAQIDIIKELVLIDTNSSDFLKLK